ncbi:hypothetical protein LHV16_05730 [Providencia rettgeri]|uniref:hypothetical protein n=1 Tax=Providencia rettgeri TaxID=587 RepID=UPI001B35F5A8|nr:hypothetical protein [Providencia rettgeri]EJD6367684.1 hypothetical protein [Providencia rettgeri]EJD6371474.1 hypothetical protein [Providencia rettgeri]ELR5161819.1 hypothetical protein [Providencia rettgeri]ELR5249056.1 hypothetical protein [Providencia rettgeri]MBQ0361320.1 hypothetical protein [Providencia rettgeri]
MDKSRQQFEEEFKKHTTLDKDDIFEMDYESDDYYYLATRQAWFWWQASRESLINNLPESINCPTSPELIWLQVDPEPEEINKPEFPVNLRSDDVTWCADRIHPTDTLYIRADLIKK